MGRKWKEYRKILDIIDKYYPKECDFDSKKYQKSKEHKRLKKVLDDKELCKKREKGFYKLVCEVLPQYYVWRWTGKSQRKYYPSTHIGVLLHENQPILDDDIELMEALGGRRFNLEIYISRISNYYYIYVIEYIYDKDKPEHERWSFAIHPETHILNKQDLKKLHQKLEEKGLVRLSDKMAHMEVPYIKTALLPRYGRKVRIFNCLFSDLHLDY